MAIKAVLFDLDDTLLWDERSVEEAFHATCVEAGRHYPLEPKQLEEAVKTEARSLYESYPTFPFTKMIGINPFEGLWGNFAEGEQEQFRQLNKLAPTYRRESWTRGLQSLGIIDPVLGSRLGEMFPAERRARPIVYEETFRVLEELKAEYKLLLLTNGSPDLQKEKISGVPELSAYWDHIVISGVFGEGKPAASIFIHALGLLDIELNEGIMVGDKQTTDILGSNNIGLKSVWINRDHKSRSDISVPDFEIANLMELKAIIESL